LVALAPDVVLATGAAGVAPLLQATSTVPIVFAQTPDPVGAGFVAGLARPGGNATGFTLSEYQDAAATIAQSVAALPQLARLRSRSCIIDGEASPAMTISIRRSPRASRLLLRTAVEHGTAGGAKVATRSVPSVSSCRTVVRLRVTFSIGR
jgi:hypothetical protein